MSIRSTRVDPRARGIEDQPVPVPDGVANLTADEDVQVRLAFNSFDLTLAPEPGWLDAGTPRQHGLLGRISQIQQKGIQEVTFHVDEFV
jgi:hypothetical protein